MSESKFRLADVDVDVRGTRKQHKVVVYTPKERVLSYLAVWLGKQKSYGTTEQYAKIISGFCSFLVFHFNCDEEIILEFWRYVTTDTITAWKTFRIQRRYTNRDKHGQYLLSPSNTTIDDQADIACKFLDWVKQDMQLVTRWDGKRKKIKQSAEIDHLLRGMVAPKSIEVLDVSANVFFDPDDKDYPVEGLKRKRQSQPNEYLNTQQIKILLNSFSDPVWKYISATVVITGLRPHEVLAVPYYVKYSKGGEFKADPNLVKEVLKFDEDADKENSEMLLRVLGKRAKEREVKISTEDWLLIMQGWMPIYRERMKLYKAKEGKDCPVDVLWLNKNGEPIYCNPRDKKGNGKVLDAIQSAFKYVSTQRRKDALSVVFGRTVDCYCLRHTYATNFVIDMVESGRCTSASEILSNYALQRYLADQMGHEEFDTTLKHYVDNAAVIMMSYKGGGIRRLVDVRAILEKAA